MSGVNIKSIIIYIQKVKKIKNLYKNELSVIKIQDNVEKLK